MVLILFQTLCAMGGDMALKQAFKDDFYVGASFNSGLFREEGQPTLELIARQFNSISPGNEMKWGPFNPKPDVYKHEPADNFVAFGAKNGMYVVGHVLFWHNQTPDWVFQDEGGKPLTRDALLKRMRERVRHMAQRYKGSIHAWDVVNEAILGDGQLRKSEWNRIIGDDFIEQAFRIANEELPADIFALFLKHREKIKRVTFWGPTDKHSWLNNWPIKGRTSYPLHFDRAGQPKAAHHAVMDLAPSGGTPLGN
jgi:endo-1,4-beta-xylanase